jgi:hypothetical protein
MSFMKVARSLSVCGQPLPAPLPEGRRGTQIASFSAIAAVSSARSCVASARASPSAAPSAAAFLCAAAMSAWCFTVSAFAARSSARSSSPNAARSFASSRASKSFAISRADSRHAPLAAASDRSSAYTLSGSPRLSLRRAVCSKVASDVACAALRSRSESALRA